MRHYSRMNDNHRLLVEIPLKMMKKSLEIPSPILKLAYTFNNVLDIIHLKGKSLIFMIESNLGF